MNARSLRLILLSVALTVALQLTGTRLAASQTPTLIARHAPAVSTTDPWDELWTRTGTLPLPLSAQLVTPPKGGTREGVRARALHDGERLYVLLEWKDQTRDGAIESVTAYSDAVALQFPAASTAEVPALCMGSPTAAVNIWSWKAAWQDGAARDFTRISSAYPLASVDAYPFADDPVYAPARALGNLAAAGRRASAVENLHAAQYGTLTTADTQPVAGLGDWRAGVWRVIFWRPLASTQEGDVRFATGDSVDAAIAVWDGAARERDGMKAVSSFFTVRLTEDPLWAPRLPLIPGLLLWPLATVVFIGALMLLRRWESRRR